MTPYNGDLTQALKWLQNNAPNLQTLVGSKSDWYNQYHTIYWENWEENIFNLKTANTFGLMIWCIILNVPSDLFGLFPLNLSWAYGNQRQNFTATGDPHAPVTNPNVPGGNFYGGGNSTILGLTEVRWALMLRYVALFSDGRLSLINEMLNYIFNDQAAWDFSSGKYFYLADHTIVDVGQPPIAQTNYMEYRVGPNMGFSSQFKTLLASPTYGIAPQVAGTKYAVIQE